MDNYKKFLDEMILRDFLALDRTYLANERTLLAYARTFIGLIAAGVGLIKLFDSAASIIAGYSLVVIAPLTMVYGIYRCMKVKKKLDSLKIQEIELEKELE